jgi:hypothetical protein
LRSQENPVHILPPYIKAGNKLYILLAVYLKKHEIFEKKLKAL